LWSIDAHDGAALGSTAFVRDVDGDGRDDVLIGTSHWPIRESVETALVDGATGRPRWRRPAIGRAVLVGWPRGKVSAVATPEDVVVVDALTGDDGVSVSAPSDARMIAPVVLDWDADGDEELVVAHVDGMIAAYDSEGELVGSALLPRAAEMFGEPGDHDGDGIADLDVDAAGPLVWTGARQRWERRAAKGLRASALVEDLDGDGEHEVIVSGRFEGVDAAFSFDARTGATKGRLARDPIHWMRAPIVARRDDGGADILATVFGGREELVRIDGATLEIQRAVPVPMTYASPALHDVDGDGADELLLAPWSGSTGIEARDPRTLEVEWTAPAHGGSWLAPVLVLGPDSERLVVDAFTDHALVAVSGVDGSPRWTVDLGLTNKGGLAVVDDGEGPVVVAVGNGLAGSKLVADVVVLAAADGTQRRRLEAIGNGGTAPLVVDIDDDGRLDVVSRTAEARVVAVPLRGGPPLWEYAPPIGESRAASGLPLLVDDLDGDGAHELVIAFRDGSLHVLDAATGTLERRHDLGAVAERPPVPVDLDADGRKELIVTLSDGRLVCLASGPAHDLGRNARPAG
jgi:outer membrane protein assembly factor BamB